MDKKKRERKIKYVGILGPSQPEFNPIIKRKYNYFRAISEQIGEILAKKDLSIVINPDIGKGKATCKIVSQSYKNSGGKNVIGIIPSNDQRWGSKTLDLSICDSIIKCNNWGDVPIYIINKSDIILIIGLSPGTMIELCWGKWIYKPFLLFKPLISAIPVEISKFVDIKDIYDVNELFEYF